MDWSLVLEWSIKSIMMVLILLMGFAWGTLYERRVLARMQVRIGPNRAGPQGFLQPVADGIKLIFKEELIPDKADKPHLLPGAYPHRRAGPDHQRCGPVGYFHYPFRTGDPTLPDRYQPGGPLYPDGNFHFHLRHHPGRLVLQ